MVHVYTQSHTWFIHTYTVTHVVHSYIHSHTRGHRPRGSFIIHTSQTRAIGGERRETKQRCNEMKRLCYDKNRAVARRCEFGRQPRRRGADRVAKHLERQLAAETVRGILLVESSTRSFACIRSLSLSLYRLGGLKLIVA